MSVQTPAITAAAVAEFLRGVRFRYHDEDRLQEAIAAALETAPWAMPVWREVPLAGCGRIDVRVGRVGIEVKVAGQATAVRRQLEGYAHSDAVDELVLVTTRASHHMPAALNGKPVEVVRLIGAAL
jgi:hypothetical protein